jgi:hypothetical protein
VVFRKEKAALVVSFVAAQVGAPRHLRASLSPDGRT